MSDSCETCPAPSGAIPFGLGGSAQDGLEARVAALEAYARSPRMGRVQFGSAVPQADASLYSDGDVFVDVLAPALYVFHDVSGGAQWVRATPDLQGGLSSALSGLSGSYVSTDAAGSFVTSTAFASEIARIDNAISALSGSSASQSSVQGAVQTASQSTLDNFRTILRGYVDRETWADLATRVLYAPATFEQSYVTYGDFDETLHSYLQVPGANAAAIRRQLDEASSSDDGAPALDDLDEAERKDQENLQRFLDALDSVGVVRRTTRASAVGALPMRPLEEDCDLGLLLERAGYVTVNVLNSRLSGYVARQEFTSTLAGYVTVDALASAGYVGKSDPWLDRFALASDLRSLQAQVTSLNGVTRSEFDALSSAVGQNAGFAPIAPRLRALELSVSQSPWLTPDEERMQIVEAAVRKISEHAPELFSAMDYWYGLSELKNGCSYYCAHGQLLGEINRVVPNPATWSDGGGYAMFEEGPVRDSVILYDGLTRCLELPPSDVFRPRPIGESDSDGSWKSVPSVVEAGLADGRSMQNVRRRLSIEWEGDLDLRSAYLTHLAQQYGGTFDNNADAPAPVMLRLKNMGGWVDPTPVSSGGKNYDSAPYMYWDSVIGEGWFSKCEANLPIGNYGNAPWVDLASLHTNMFVDRSQVAGAVDRGLARKYISPGSDSDSWAEDEAVPLNSIAICFKVPEGDRFVVADSETDPACIRHVGDELRVLVFRSGLAVPVGFPQAAGATPAAMADRGYRISFDEIRPHVLAVSAGFMGPVSGMIPYESESDSSSGDT